MKQLLRNFLVFCTLMTLFFGLAAQVNTEVIIDKHVSCPYGENAEISINVLGAGDGNVIIQWENTKTSENDFFVAKGPTLSVSFPKQGEKNTPIASGELKITVVDATSAPSINNKTKTAVIHEPKAISVSVDQPKDDSNHGVIEFQSQQDNNLFQYQYSIDGGKNYQENPLFENVSMGSYSARVRITSSNTECNIDEDIIIKGKSVD